MKKNMLRKTLPFLATLGMLCVAGCSSQEEKEARDTLISSLKVAAQKGETKTVNELVAGGREASLIKSKDLAEPTRLALKDGHRETANALMEHTGEMKTKENIFLTLKIVGGLMVFFSFAKVMDDATRESPFGALLDRTYE